MKSQYDHSIRAFDGAHLVWRRDMNVSAGEIEFGFWYLVKVTAG
jgi:hypothetical protein